MKWQTADGRLIKFEDMELSHIRNSIAKIRRSIRTDMNGKLKGWRVRMLKPLVAELERRGRKDNNTLHPAKLSNRFRNLDLN